MNIKLAAIDLDGTLLTDQYEMTPRTKEAVQNMQKQEGENRIRFGERS